jgi:hypothetical protein
VSADAIPSDNASTDEQELVPFVPDQGEDESDGGQPASFSASIGGKDWTVETLVSQMRKNRIDLSPSFQRRNAWLDNRKSKLIESICLGFPIPQIVLAEKRGATGAYLVLDGKQRLLALRQFFASDDDRDAGFTPLKLERLEVLPELNGMYFSDLEKARPDLAAQVENHDMRTVVLSDWNSEAMLLSLFLRLNTGSVPLSPQELRQALIPGAFLRWLDETSGDMPALRALLGNTHPDRRMADAELLLRHLSFAGSPLEYRGNLKGFLDETSKIFNSEWEMRRSATESAADDFNEGLLALIDVLGDHTCRKWSGQRFERALNRALFDVQAYSMLFPAVREALPARRAEVVELFQSACVDDVAFVRSISATTKTADAFTIRHRTWAGIVKAATGVDYPSPGPLHRN